VGKRHLGKRRFSDFGQMSFWGNVNWGTGVEPLFCTYISLGRPKAYQLQDNFHRYKKWHKSFSRSHLQLGRKLF
jgi:hypothetical protein